MKTKNIIKSLSGVILLAAIFVSCEKEPTTDNVSTITYYPKFEKTGDDVYVVPSATDFTEPGIKAIENGVDIPVTTVVEGINNGYSGNAIKNDVPDEYHYTYSATNSDGFDGYDSRLVWKAPPTGDLVTSIEGLYTSSVVRNGVSRPQYDNMEYIMIYKTGANTYKISCGIGGYYAHGRSYGTGYYAQSSTITANDIPTNDFAVDGDFTVGSFGGVCSMSGITVDAAAKTVSFSTDWDAGYTFVVTMTQVQL